MTAALDRLMELLCDPGTRQVHQGGSRLKSRRGPQMAICAVATSILTAVYHTLKPGAPHHDPPTAKTKWPTSATECQFNDRPVAALLTRNAVVFPVMTGLVPVIHVLVRAAKTWMTGPSPVMTMGDGRLMQRRFHSGRVGRRSVWNSAMTGAERGGL